MVCKKCGNDRFFSKYDENVAIAYVCSKCRNEQPIKKESGKKSPEYNKNEGEQE